MISPSKAELARAGALIRDGRLVAFPTETVYGLGANALDPAAVRRIFEAKGRPVTSPLIVHVASVESALRLARHWPEAADALAARFWPGPLTLVVPKASRIPDVVTSGLDTVGLRVPAHPVALALLAEAGVPIAAPSANRFTRLSPTTAAHVRDGLGDAVDLVLDGGPTRVGIESTVLSLVGNVPRLLRPGMISRARLEEVIGPVEAAGRVENGAAHPSPGMHPRHYSPATPLLVVSSGEVPSRGRGVYLGLSSPREPAPAAFVAMPEDPGAYAAVLYEILHRLDRQGYEWIAIERPPATAEWAGIADRLERAAHSS